VLKQQLELQEEKNKALLARNNAMDAEVHDLKTGTDALEDRARIEMRMIKKDETYVQILTPNEPQPQVPVSYEVPAPADSKKAEVAAADKPKATAKTTANARTQAKAGANQGRAKSAQPKSATSSRSQQQ